MITARDIALPHAPAWTVTPAAAAMPLARPTTLVERVLRGLLYVTILLSCIAFIEPSPHDGLMGLLLLVALIAGLRIDRVLVPLILSLLIWNIGGLLSLMNVADNAKAIQYTATTVYLSVATMLFACLFARETMPRMAAMRSAYIAAAVIGSIAGVIGYFNLIPSLTDKLTLYSRATGFFKDPNVFGPFLIWPALFLVARMLTERIMLRDCVAQLVILFGLLLTLSRGAWMHFAVSGGIALALLFLTSTSPRFRMRMVALTVVGLFVFVALAVVAFSIPHVRDMFIERANLLNYYDAGEHGRFGLQSMALQALLDLPNGMGPFEFARVYGLQQHNVYLQAFIVYGWIGGVAYLLMLVATLIVGLRNAFVATPWQTYAIITFGVFVGEVIEGFVIDTDHWRHFFLILGTVWGLAAATRYHRNTLQAVPA